MNVLVLHDTCTELVSYCISCCLVHQLSSLSGMLSTINRVSSKTEHTVIKKCPLVNTTLRYSRQDLHSLVQHREISNIMKVLQSLEQGNAPTPQEGKTKLVSTPRGTPKYPMLRKMQRSKSKFPLHT